MRVVEGVRVMLTSVSPTGLVSGSSVQTHGCLSAPRLSRCSPSYQNTGQSLEVIHEH